MICPSCQSANDDDAEVCFACRAVLSAVTRGTVLAGRYEILDKLGRGGMGVVFKAHDRRLDETVAIKILRSELACDTDTEQRLVGEIKLARRVSHRNVCRIHEYGEDSSRSFISMEFVDGVDLKRLIRERGPLPPAEAYDVAVQVVQGLEAIHEAGIVHRDLKTANLMRDSRGVVRLMDFGVAKRTTGLTGSTGESHGWIVGTPEYMSPEQAWGRKADFRSDIYALGVVVFELFTGQVPFKSDSPSLTLQMHLDEPPTLDGAVAAKLPRAVVPVLRRALARQPEDRYQSCAEMRQALALAAAGAGDPQTAETPPLRLAGASLTASVLRRLAAWPRLRLSGTRLGLLAAVLMAGLGLGIVWRLTTQDRPTPGPAGPPVPTAHTEGQSSRPIASAPPEGRGDEAHAAVDAIAPGPSAGGAAAMSPVSTGAPSLPGQVPASAVVGGELWIGVLPWAKVTVDGTPYGNTPLPPLRLAAGVHLVRLVHPDYKPIQRRLTVRPGEVARLQVDFALVGIPK